MQRPPTTRLRLTSLQAAHLQATDRMGDSLDAQAHALGQQLAATQAAATKVRADALAEVCLEHGIKSLPPNVRHVLMLDETGPPALELEGVSLPETKAEPSAATAQGGSS